MRSMSATERPIGPATGRTASKPGFGPSNVRQVRKPTSRQIKEKEGLTRHANSCGVMGITKHSPTAPPYATRPCPGLRPNIPQYPDGMRILPPTSEPTPSAAPSAASSAPSPPEEPPGVCAADHGLVVRPQRGLALSKARSVWGTFVLAKITAPAARSVETTYTGRRVRGVWQGKVGWERSKFGKNVRRHPARLACWPTVCTQSYYRILSRRLSSIP